MPLVALFGINHYNQVRPLGLLVAVDAKHLDELNTLNLVGRVPVPLTWWRGLA